MLDIMSTIRKVCVPKSGSVALCDENKSYDTLLSLADNIRNFI